MDYLLTFIETGLFAVLYDFLVRGLVLRLWNDFPLEDLDFDFRELSLFESLLF